jgi:hypothetical protein
MIVEARNAELLGRGMMGVGARLARVVNRIAGRSGRVFDGRYHSRLLHTPKEVRAALRYVLLNARHHAAAASRHATVMRAGMAGIRLDPASSARWFDGWKRDRSASGGEARAAPPSVPPAVQPSVARARTWLLRVGWRRHGLLDPADVPG